MRTARAGSADGARRIAYESYKPSGSGRARRAGALATGPCCAVHALRAMVSEASTRANLDFATGAVHHLKPSIEAVN